MNEKESELVTALKSLLFPGGAPAQVSTQQVIMNQPKVRLPYGCTEMIADGIYAAKNVNDLNSWENHVECEDGGTYKGIKILYIRTEPIKRSEKSYSLRDGFMARFEISRAGGRNPMNEVINVFVKRENDYKPYLDPAKWSVKQEIAVFESEEAEEQPRKFRLNMIYFMNELISDSVERKCSHIAKRLKGMYTCTVSGEEIEIDNLN